MLFFQPMVIFKTDGNRYESFSISKTSKENMQCQYLLMVQKKKTEIIFFLFSELLNNVQVLFPCYQKVTTPMSDLVQPWHSVQPVLELASRLVTRVQFLIQIEHQMVRSLDIIDQIKKFQVSFLPQCPILLEGQILVCQVGNPHMFNLSTLTNYCSHV